MKEAKRKRQPLTITVNPKVVREAKALGLNLSVVSENALKEAIARLKGVRKHAQKKGR